MATQNTTLCPVCFVPITRPARWIGRFKTYCSDDCSAKGRAAKKAAKQYEQCSVDGCLKPATRVGSRMCEMHYVRQYRNGTTKHIGHKTPAGIVLHSNGYVLQAAPGHPRALGGYRAYQHRVVFTDAHGEGPFNCHWCSKRVTWADMHVDHLDNIKTNNAIGNLVASCALCNTARGRETMKATMRRKHGVTVAGRTLSLKQWAQELGVVHSSVNARIKAGWTRENAVLTPRGRFGPKSKAANVRPRQED